MILVWHEAASQLCALAKQLFWLLAKRGTTFIFPVLINKLILNNLNGSLQKVKFYIVTVWIFFILCDPCFLSNSWLGLPEVIYWLNLYSLFWGYDDYNTHMIGIWLKGKMNNDITLCLVSCKIMQSISIDENCCRNSYLLLQT